MINILEFSVFDTVSINDAENLSDITREEKNLLYKSPSDMYEEANKYGCLLLKDKDIIVGFIKLEKVDSFYKIGTFYVNKLYRRNNISEYIFALLYEKVGNLPIYLITNSPRVVSIAIKNGMKELSPKYISKEKLVSIEKNRGKPIVEEKILGNSDFTLF